jgi:hypothetical protein
MCLVTLDGVPSGIQQAAMLDCSAAGIQLIAYIQLIVSIYQRAMIW